MTKEDYKEKTKIDQKTDKEEKHFLILLNDDYHSFDYVISALIDICKHTEQQAAQCTMITHYKGKCDVKTGSLSELRPMRKALVDRELKAQIN
ncbi:MAG: ATP-dependent Clp protease adaptor ClpS [Prolixibacteraceae bacterium]